MIAPQEAQNHHHQQEKQQSKDVDEIAPLRYEFVAVNRLPPIRITRSVKSVLLSRRNLQCFNRFTDKINSALLGVLTLSLPPDVAVLFVDELAGR